MAKPSVPSGTTIRLSAAAGTFEAVLDDHPIAAELLQRLPFSSMVERWGDELYFTVPLQVPNSHPTQQVRVGDLAYWPEGPSLCIFFGRTPSSQGLEPRPASSVTIIGRTDASPELLRLIDKGSAIALELSHPRAKR